MRATEFCPKCDKPYDGVTVLFSRHHIRPSRFFPGSKETIDLCRNCHNEIEMRIPVKKKLPIRIYYQIVNNFLGYEAVKVPNE